MISHDTPCRVKIFCRSFDLRLYRMSSALYASMGIPVVRLTDQKADGYFYTMLADTSCDVAVNVDEDAFVVSPERVMRLVRFVVDNGYANAGCPDGGGACPRSGNPIVTNPFFNVFNLKLIREKFSVEAVRAYRYELHRPQLEAAFPVERLQTRYDFSRTDYEPYYPFMLWLAGNFKTLYLPSHQHSDGITTILCDVDDVPICLHTWFARFYSTPTWIVNLFQKGMGTQRARINDVIHEAYTQRAMSLPVFGWTDRLQFVADRLVRWLIKIPQRIMGWPRKWRRWYLRHRQAAALSDGQGGQA
ncbi:MAG: hypothetical protein IJ680_09295 [Paludibacteraceae bacterium]|nr:hypothetical protein [Paludibacteraceae bacterium]